MRGERILEVARIADECPARSKGLAQESLATGEDAQRLIRLWAGDRGCQCRICLAQDLAESCHSIGTASQARGRHRSENAVPALIGWDGPGTDAGAEPPVRTLQIDATKIAEHYRGSMAPFPHDLRSGEARDAGAHAIRADD